MDEDTRATDHTVMREAHAILDAMNIPDDERSLIERLRDVAAQWERRQRGNIYGLNEVQVARLHTIYTIASEWAQLESARALGAPQTEQMMRYREDRKAALIDAVQQCNSAFRAAWFAEEQRHDVRTADEQARDHA